MIRTIEGKQGLKERDLQFRKKKMVFTLFSVFAKNADLENSSFESVLFYVSKFWLISLHKETSGSAVHGDCVIAIEDCIP